MFVVPNYAQETCTNLYKGNTMLDKASEWLFDSGEPEKIMIRIIGGAAGALIGYWTVSSVLYFIF